MEHVQLLGDSALNALKCLVGKPLHQLFTRSVDVYQQFVVAPNFTIPLGESRFCVIESDRADTVVHAVDYHMIEVAILDKPKGFSLVAGRDAGHSLG